MTLMQAACLLAVALPVLGDLGTAVRKAQKTPTVFHLPAAAPLTGPLVIPLKKASPRGSTSKELSIYVGEVSIGQPAQVLSVTFDTASGHLLVPHRACHNASCLEHRRFSPWESSTAIDTNADGGHIDGVHGRLARGRHVRDVATLSFTQADLGEGEVKGVFVRDAVCVKGDEGAEACVDMAALVATSMDDKPFRSMPGDGIVGLGLASLATSPEASFLGRLFEGSANVLPQFGLALAGARGEMHLGGHDSANFAGPLRWFPVDHPEQGFWQVAIQAVRVGNRTVDACKEGCHGIVDSGVSTIGVQTSRLPALRRALQSGLARAPHCGGPELSFDLGGTTLVLKAQDYVDKGCSLNLGSLDLPEPEFVGVYALGGALLHRYYTAFDWEQKRLGFAPLAHAGPAGRAGQLMTEELNGVLLV